MIIGFRQGVVRRQHDISGQPANLKKSSVNNSIDLVVNPTQTVVTFTDGDRDYLYKFMASVDQAWGPFSGSNDQYLLVDMNMGSGKASFVSTIYPIYYSSTTPSPFYERNNQHWYDIANSVMKHWSGNKWRPVLRVHVGTYRYSGSTIEYAPIGTPITDPEYSVRVRSGSVVFDENGKPIRRRDGKFLTSEDTLTSNNAATLNSGYRIDQEYSKRVRSLTILPAFSCVSLIKDDLVYLADHRNVDRVVSGVIVEECSPGYDVQLLTYGRVYNPLFSFEDSDIGKNVYTGTSGEITLTAPQEGLFQIVGTVYDNSTIFVNIEPPIELNTGASSRPAYPPLNGGTDPVTGDVVGPDESIANEIVLFSDTTGSVLKQSGVTIDVNGNIAGAGRPVKIISSTAYTVLPGDDGYNLYFTSDQPIAVTLPEFDAGADPLVYTVGYNTKIIQGGAGIITVAKDIGSTDILLAPVDPLVTAGSGTLIDIAKLANNIWLATSTGSIPDVEVDVITYHTYAAFTLNPPPADTLIIAWPVSPASAIQLNWQDCLATIQTASTVDFALDIKHNGTTIGTISFLAGETTGTFSAIAETPIALGDSLTVHTQSAISIDFLGLSIKIILIEV